MTAREKTPQELGKEFEQDFQALLKSVQNSSPAIYHRFYDTHSAGTFLPSQPGDFLMLYQGQGHLFELKSSDTHDSLSSGLSSLLDKDQAAHLRLWARAGAATHVIFWAQKTGVIEWWDGKVVAEHRAAGKRLPANTPRLGFENFRQFSNMFTSIIRAESRHNIFQSGAKHGDHRV